MGRNWGVRVGALMLTSGALTIGYVLITGFSMASPLSVSLCIGGILVVVFGGVITVVNWEGRFGSTLDEVVRSERHG